MQKLLIADYNDLFRLSLADALKDHFQVFLCSSGKEALDLLRAEQPDILVMEMLLPEIDGLTLLETAIAEGIRPRILIMDRMLTDYVFDCMQRLGILYMMRKPCDISAAAARICDLSRLPMPSKPKPRDPQTRASELLLSLHLFPNHDGFSYLVQALLRSMQDPHIAVTKILYPEIAKSTGRKSKNVERSIRTAIEAGWNHRDPEVWSQYFSNTDKRPSNAVFISRLASALLSQQE